MNYLSSKPFNGMVLICYIGFLHTYFRVTNQIENDQEVIKSAHREVNEAFCFHYKPVVEKHC